jgi:hypothetical protein
MFRFPAGKTYTVYIFFGITKAKEFLTSLWREPLCLAAAGIGHSGGPACAVAKQPDGTQQVSVSAEKSRI